MRVNRSAIVVLGIFAALVYLFAWSPIFQVKSISVSGLPSQIREEVVVKSADIFIGEKLSRVQPRSVSRRLETLSWVKSSHISRNWLNGAVSISLTARTPVGIFNGRALDASGTLFTYPGKLSETLPKVGASTPQLGLSAIALFKALPVDIRSTLISITAHNESSISSWQTRTNGDGVVEKIKVQWGSLSQISLKVSVYKALLALPENSHLSRMDLSAPHAPIVK